MITNLCVSLPHIFLKEINNSNRLLYIKGKDKKKLNLSLYYNYTLVSAVASWLAAQLIKTVIHAVQNKTFRAERLIGSGGMPSSHSALVCSASVATFRLCGAESVEFALMLIMALIVMYDAMGVRRAAGLHAHQLNRITRYFDEEGIEIPNYDTNKKPSKKPKKQTDFKEYLGHTPFQVLAGIILGIIIAFIMPVQI